MSLRYDIKQHENHLEKFTIEHPVAADHVLFMDHSELRDRLSTSRNSTTNLKVEFMRCLADRM